ncbi:MAG: HEAT repeat domain-containing protein [Acidobacteriia bacterium]|nr:HEAT repeat domain-containing protein [Terriglobia bacterium]
MIWWKLRQLKSGNPWKRSEAARELGRSRERRAVEPLLALMRTRDIDPDVAAAALGSIGDPRAVEPLCECLSRHRDTPRVACEVMLALRDIGDRRAIPFLVSALESVDPLVRERAVEVLAQLAWTPTSDAEKALVALAKKQWDAFRGLGEDAVPVLADALYNDRGQAIPEVVNALTMIAGLAAVEVLITMLFRLARQGYLGEDGGVVQALVSMGPCAASPLASRLRQEMQRVREALAGPGGDSPNVTWAEERIREATADVFRGIGGPSLQPLLELIGDSDDRVRIVAAESMAFIHDHRVVPALERALADTSFGVRVMALKALRRHGWEPRDDASRRLRDTATFSSTEHPYLGLGRRLDQKE